LVEEMRELLAAIDTTSLLGLRDRALIALMGYTFARVGAVIYNRSQSHVRSWSTVHSLNPETSLTTTSARPQDLKSRDSGMSCENEAKSKRPRASRTPTCCAKS
jgi:hypothetical protein